MAPRHYFPGTREFSTVEKVTVVQPFRGVADGEVYPKEFKAGDTVEGELAEVAVSNGWARRNKGAAPENKA